MSEETPGKIAGSLAKHLIATLEASVAKVDDQSDAGALARGRIFQLAGYYSEATANYIEALRVDPAADEAAARLVVVKMILGHFDEALGVATTLASRNSKFEYKESSSDQVVSAMTLLGDALAAVDRPNDAIEAYTAARESNPRDTFAAGRLAQLYLATGEPKRAVDQAEAISSNTRFAALARTLARGAERALFLPAIRPDGLAGMLRVSMPGRPVLVDDEARVAPLLTGCDAWCANVGYRS